MAITRFVHQAADVEIDDRISTQSVIARLKRLSVSASQFVLHIIKAYKRTQFEHHSDDSKQDGNKNDKQR